MMSTYEYKIVEYNAPEQLREGASPSDRYVEWQQTCKWLNMAAWDGWRVVATAIVKDRLVVTYERKTRTPWF